MLRQLPALWFIVCLALTIKSSFIGQGQCLLKLRVAKRNQFSMLPLQYWCKNRVNFCLYKLRLSLQAKLALKGSLSWEASVLPLLLGLSLCLSLFLCCITATLWEAALQNASLEWFGLRILLFFGIIVILARFRLLKPVQSHRRFLRLKWGLGCEGES